MPPDSNWTSDSDHESVFIPKAAPKVCGHQLTDKKYICSIAGCNQSFKRRAYLDRHEYHHTGVKQHGCTHEGCGKSYITTQHLKRHILVFHEKFKPPEKVKCEIESCDHKFGNVDSMNRHVRDCHNTPAVYYCSHCKEKFTHRNKMKIHEISKHTKIYPFKCDKCSKGSYTHWQHQTHKCKVYDCLYCHLKFSKWTELVKHRKDSSECKPSFKCELCSKVFNRPSLLKTHMTFKHPNDDETLKYVCEYEGCTRSYQYERNLRQHIKVSHIGLTFSCTADNCKQMFKSKQALLKHVAMSHNINANKPVKTTPPKASKKERSRRKDAGKKTRSIIPKMLGMVVDLKTEKLLLNRKNGNIDLEIESDNEIPDQVEPKDSDHEKELELVMEKLIEETDK